MYIKSNSYEKDNFSFQKLASGAIYLYLNDKDFKVKLQKQLFK